MSVCFHSSSETQGLIVGAEWSKQTFVRTDFAALFTSFRPNYRPVGLREWLSLHVSSILINELTWFFPKKSMKRLCLISPNLFSEHPISRQCFAQISRISKYQYSDNPWWGHTDIVTTMYNKVGYTKTLKTNILPLNLSQKETPKPFPHSLLSTRQSPLGTATLKWLTSSTLSTPKRVCVAPSRASKKVEEEFWLRDSVSWPLFSSSRLHLPSIWSKKKQQGLILHQKGLFTQAILQNLQPVVIPRRFGWNSNEISQGLSKLWRKQGHSCCLKSWFSG